MKDLAVKGDSRECGRGPFAVSPPVDEFGFCDGEGDVELSGPPGEIKEQVLQASYVGSVRWRCHCEGEVIHVRDNDARGDAEMKRGDVYHEEKG